MKRLIQFAALFCAFVLLAAPGCEREDRSGILREQKSIQSSRDSITSVFTTDSLSPEMLTAYEESAKLLFADFSDYLNILSDTTLAPEFKAKTRQMILDMFISEYALIGFSNENEVGMEKVALVDLLDRGNVFIKSSEKLQPDSILISEPLHQVNDTLLQGRLTYIFRPSPSHPNEKKYLFSGRSIEFFTLKRMKRFGKEEYKVWTVLLGESGI